MAGAPPQPGPYSDYGWPREALYEPMLAQGEHAAAATGYPAQSLHQPAINLPQPLSSDLSSRGTGSPASPFDSGQDIANAIVSAKRFPPPHIPPRKKPRTADKEEDSIDIDPSLIDKEEKAKPTRGARACAVCRRLKMKCVGAENPPCKRCVAGNHECIFEESNRGKRSSNQQKKHELLTRSLRKMERTLDTVLKSISTQPGPNPVLAEIASEHAAVKRAAASQGLFPSQPAIPIATSSFPANRSPKLHSLPDNALNPLGLLAEASLANRKTARGQSEPDINSVANASQESLGVANSGYFKPGPMTILPLRRLYIERQVQPEMLTFVSLEDVKGLFNVYFAHLNPHCCLLIPDFHTPSLVCSRSPFLLTTICAISAKFYNLKPEVNARLNSLAKHLSFNVLERGYKSVEIVQAYLLLTLWGAGHTEKYEQEKTWLLLGMAIRVATDLNLHRKTAITSPDTPEGKAREREARNRERTWLLCFCLDRSLSAQMGKPHSIKEDNIVRNVSQWWQNPTSEPSDAGLAAYVEFQRILSRSLDFLYSGTSSVSGLQVDCDYLVVTRTIETQLQSWYSDWKRHWQSVHPVLPTGRPYTHVISDFYFNYSLLLVNSFGLQNAMDKSPVDIGHFFARCHTAASSCAIIARDELGPGRFLRYSPDSHFVQLSYAVLTLLKLIRPEFRPYMENEQRTLSLVIDIATLLGDIAVGNQHTPALYGAFLKALISVKTAPSRTSTPTNNNLSNSVAEERSGIPDAGPMMDESHQDGTRELIQPSLMLDAAFPIHDFQMTGEMGPAADLSVFPPVMMSPQPVAGDSPAMLSMDSILSPSFWDSVLIPGFSNSFEGLSGGIVYGAGGSGLITPRVESPTPTMAITMEQGMSLPAEGNESGDFTFS